MTVEKATDVTKSNIKDSAKKFIESAYKKFNIKLDFSEESLVTADDLITLFFKKHKPHYYKAAVFIGSFLGEVIIKNLGGKWQEDLAIRKVGKTKVLVNPIAKAAKRLSEGLNNSLSAYYISLKLSSCFDSDFASDTNKINKVREKLRTEGWDKKLLNRILNEKESKYVKEESAYLLGKIGDKSIIKSLLEALKSPQSAYYSAIALQGIPDDRSFAPLMDALHKTKSYGTKMQIILALGELKNDKAADILIDYLNDSNEMMAYYASISLGKIGGDKVLNKLLNILGGIIPGRRIYAVSALEIMQDKRAVPALIESLFSDDEEVKEAAVRSFQFIPDLTAYKPLLSLLKNSSIRIRVLATYALAHIDRDKTLPYLKELLADKTPLVRQHADQLIKMIESGQKQIVKCI